MSKSKTNFNTFLKDCEEFESTELSIENEYI